MWDLSPYVTNIFPVCTVIFLHLFIFNDLNEWWGLMNTNDVFIDEKSLNHTLDFNIGIHFIALIVTVKLRPVLVLYGLGWDGAAYVMQYTHTRADTQIQQRQNGRWQHWGDLTSVHLSCLTCTGLEMCVYTNGVLSITWTTVLPQTLYYTILVRPVLRCQDGRDFQIVLIVSKCMNVRTRPAKDTSQMGCKTGGVISHCLSASHIVISRCSTRELNKPFLAAVETSEHSAGCSTFLSVWVMILKLACYWGHDGFITAVCVMCVGGGGTGPACRTEALISEWTLLSDNCTDCLYLQSDICFNIYLPILHHSSGNTNTYTILTICIAKPKF